MGYLTFGQIEILDKTETYGEENSSFSKKDVNIHSLSFDTSNVINGSGNLYTLINDNDIFYLTLDETGKIVNLNYNRKILSNQYGLNWDITEADEEIYENKKIVFEKEIKDICFGLIGQDTADYILFLMNDGTVEYIPIHQALLANGIDGLVSYGALQGIEDVVKFYPAYATVGLTGNSSTILAQTKDGTLYDLAKILSA